MRVVRLERDRTFGCLVWHGPRGRNGRPIEFRGGSIVSAHKLAYERRFGAVPADYVLDHLCRNELCIEPEHLEAVTKAENEKRKSLKHLLRRATCRHGHDLTAHRLMSLRGGVLCRLCTAALIANPVPDHPTRGGHPQ